MVIEAMKAMGDGYRKYEIETVMEV